MEHGMRAPRLAPGEQKFTAAAKGDQLTGVSAPVSAAKVNTETPPVRLATNKRLPLTTNALGPTAGAVDTGVPAADRTPVERSIVNTDMVLSPWLATNTSLPAASPVMATGGAPTGIGSTGPVEPVTDWVCSVSTPVSRLSVNCEIAPAGEPS